MLRSVWQRVPRRYKRPLRPTINRVLGLRDRLTFARRVREHTPVLVLQMGKCGSTSIHRSLLAQYPGVVVHAHSFKADHGDWAVRRLRRYVIDDGGPVRIISLTREPVGRNVSAFFQNFQRDAGVPYAPDAFSLDQLRERFLRNYPHDTPLTWFQDHVGHEFGIDVYATPFPASGIGRYERGNRSLLVMRCELDDTSKAVAVGAFVGLPGFAVDRANQSDRKPYAGTYRDFVEHVRLPDEYLDRMCGSQMFRHFYDEQTIRKVRRWWMQTAWATTRGAAARPEAA